MAYCTWHLKTRGYLKNWCRLKVSDRCPRCGKRESCSHALCECTSVPQVWLWAFTLINKFFSITLAPLPPSILFKHGLPTGNKHSIVLVHVIINVTLNEIWAARNLATFENSQQPASATICKVKHLLRQRIRAAYNFNNSPVFKKSGATSRSYVKSKIRPFRSLFSYQAPGSRAGLAVPFTHGALPAPGTHPP